MKSSVFWVGVPCSLVEVCRRFRGACCLHFQGDRPDNGCQRNNPEDSHLHTATDFAALCTYTNVYVATLWALQWVIRLALHREESDEVVMILIAALFHGVGTEK
jgi:hypothetical protein